MPGIAAAADPETDLHGWLAGYLRRTDLPIPPYPASAAAIAKLAAADNVGIDQIARIVATDSALAAAVLRRASSAQARTSAPATLNSAIYKLGSRELARLAFATSLGAVATTRGALAVLRREAWSRALVAANLAHELAPRRGVSPDEAFLAALLHDFGAIVVLAALEKLPGGTPALHDLAWTGLVAELHIEMGKVIASRWGLAPALAEVIAFHHDPQHCNLVHRPLVQLVALTDQVIAVLERPDLGMAALTQIADLVHDECLRIGWVIDHVAQQLAELEQAAPSGPSALVRHAEPGWPVDLRAEIRGVRYQGARIGHSCLVLQGSARLEPGWLVDVALDGPFVPWLGARPDVSADRPWLRDRAVAVRARCHGEGVLVGDREGRAFGRGGRGDRGGA